MWLDLKKLIHPVSLGPGIMQNGTDGIPIQQGTRRALADGATVLRIPKDVGKTELDRPLFAHTSPIYVEPQGRRTFHVDVAKELVAEIWQSIKTIEEKAVFADDGER